MPRVSDKYYKAYKELLTCIIWQHMLKTLESAVVWGLPGCLPAPVDLSPGLREAVEAQREERPRALDCASEGVTGRSGLGRGSRPDAAEPDLPRPRGLRQEVLFPLGVPGGAAAVRGQVEEGRGRHRETLRPARLKTARVPGVLGPGARHRAPVARVGQSERRKERHTPLGLEPSGSKKDLAGRHCGPDQAWAERRGARPPGEATGSAPAIWGTRAGLTSLQQANRLSSRNMWS
ncbi:hypothetical protein NDU88_007010 [Pleurodeles waltl]|uniref:Uncharacterized protein n=1 Tax=Pleurodeles waltl TaxID=8319 RepID=A0AAV7RRR4_PLEWA|nr:hypothetical protein NDU88_007010 [Pleurodeles waltl]